MRQNYCLIPEPWPEKGVRANHDATDKNHLLPVEIGDLRIRVQDKALNGAVKNPRVAIVGGGIMIIPGWYRIIRTQSC